MIEPLRYSKGREVYTAEVDLDRVGVMVIDMQDEFLKKIDPDEKEVMFAAQIDLLDVCREYDYPALLLEYTGWGKTQKELYQSFQTVPRKAEFMKKVNNGFTHPFLSFTLDMFNIETIVIAGISAPYCVKGTAEVAIEEDKKIITARQLIASQIDRQKEFRESLSWFSRECIYVQTYTTITEMMKRK
jgi:isochorismate hydrolase